MAKTPSPLYFFKSKPKLPSYPEWKPSEKVKTLVTVYGQPIHGNAPINLWLMSTFYNMGDIPNVSGITISKDHIVFDCKICDATDPKFQAKLIYHELVHVVQQMEEGWRMFMLKYFGQWIKAGMSYDNMRKFGYEKEAYDLADAFFWKIANVRI